MSIAPYIGNLGGIFNFLAVIAVFVPRPNARAVVAGRAHKRATGTGGIITLVSGVVLAGILSWVVELNMLYVAFFTFCYALPTLWIISGFTQPHSDEHLKNPYLLTLGWTR